MKPSPGTILSAIVRRRGGGSRDTAGAVAVELAITSPFLVLLILGIIDFSGYMNSSQQIAAATRIGAEYARDSTTCRSSTTGVDTINNVVNSQCLGSVSGGTRIEGMMQNSMNFSPALTIPIAPALTCNCDDGTLANPNTTNGCGNYSCAANNRPSPNRVFITITASLAINPLVSWPGFPSTVTGLTQIRLQ
jgi:Flp pilus assembly protein TadG